MGLLFWSCEDDRTEEPLVESIQMWVNGTEIIAREYYESITTYGAYHSTRRWFCKEDIRTTLPKGRW